MLRLRPLAALLCLAVVLCLLGLWSGRAQTGALRRVTNTTEEGINLNPSLSGDGRRIAFESTEDVAHAGGSDFFRAIRADLSSDPAAFVQMGAARSPAPGISQDGSIIAFAAKENPLGTNPDGNSEIFLFNGTTLRQITNTTPSDISSRVRDGNFLPSLSDDGRFIAFSSNRNLAGQNADGNLEIFIFDTGTNAFTQLTNTTGAVGASDAKISGDGSRVAYIRDTGAQASAQRDLVLQDRAGNTVRILAGSVPNLALTYGRAISDDGLRVVYSGDVAANSSQVFLFDGRTTNAARQITALGVRDTDVPLHPTISGDGTRLAFATRRAVPTTGSNTDNSIELYTYDLPTGQYGRITSAASTADGFSGSTRLAEVVSSLSDDGSVVAFNFPRRLSGEVTSGTENNSEIYATATGARPTTGSLTILNEASFGREPSPIKAVAPDSRAVALGGALAFTTEQVPKPENGAQYPTTFGGTSVTVNNRPAQIFFISPTQVNFLVPAQTELGTATVVVTNAEGFQSRGTVTVLRTAPGIFTGSHDGQGPAIVLNADTGMAGDPGTPGQFDPSNGNLRLVIFTTGVRKATQVAVTAGGRALTVESFNPSPDMPGMDEVRVLVPADLRGAGTVNLVVKTDNDRESNPATIIFGGNACRNITINEVLADPPVQNGDANRDGTISSSDDEFVELVNTTGIDIDISGYQLLTRSSSAASDTLRHLFAAGTIFPAHSAIVVFGGGGNLNQSDPAFGGAQIFKASSGGLGLTNSGAVVTLREPLPSQAIVNIFSYGGSTGLNGDADQSLTRAPDAGTTPQCGAFSPHKTAPGTNGQPFSPGTQVNGQPFPTSTIARIEVTPTSATIDAGAKQQFTAKAYDASNTEIPGIIFFWQSSNPSVATIDQTGLATAVSAGMTEIRASARGIQSAPATLTVRDIDRVLTTVTVSPSTATTPVSGTQQFTARGFDQFGNEITGLTFTWESTSTNVATIDQSGLATGVSLGQTTIKATSGGVTGTATLNVTPPTVVINEVLADPFGTVATDLQGDANHDNTRSGTDDEFVELVNSTGNGISVAGWTLRTRATGSTTETVRHTFAANTTLPAGEAIVVFGGGAFDAANAAFGCAQVVKASSGGLSLTNSGLTVIIRDAGGNVVTQFTYGTGTALAADNDQSLTRSPDITGNFVQHTVAAGNSTKRFSPGTRVNGTPFGSCPARLTSINISPPAASVVTGQSTQFTAQAFDQFGNSMTGVAITFASDNTSVATVDSVTTDPGTGIATATVTGHAPGTAHITAQATQGATTVTSSQATLTVSETAITYQVNGQVKDAGGNPLSEVLITFEMNSQGGLSTKTTLTDANGNYSSGDLGCQNTVKVTPSKAGLTFTPSSLSFTSTGCLAGSDTANFTGATPPPGTLVISQLYVAGGNASATYSNDFVEIFNSGTTTVDFSVTPYSIQYVGTTGSFGSTSASNKTNLTAGTIAPGQYFLVQEASGGATGVALPTPDATGSINMAATGGKVALVLGTAALPAATCPGDDSASPFNPANSTIADFVGYGGSATTTGHCYEGPGPAPAPASTAADFRKAGGCVDTNFNADDFLVSTPAPRNTASALNDCSAGLKPEVTINDTSVSESTSNATFTVTLSTVSTLTVTVNYSTANGTATAGADYTAVSGTLTFAPGETTKSILVPILNDTMDEPSETFFVNLSAPSNAVILDNQGQGTITDNDSAPTISINDVAVAEGDAGTTNATFNVTLSAASGFTVTVNYATTDNSATAGSDYQSTTGTLTFNPGETSKPITVLVNGDTTFEVDETFFVDLSAPSNATILDNRGQGTITNDDAAPAIPAITINDPSVAEGDSGTKILDFTVSLSMTPTETTTVDYATANGTATAGADYQSTSGTVTFAPGETSKTVSVIINGDTLVEPDETFFVNLTNASVNAVLTDGQGVGTITNDDTANLVISQVYGGGNNSGASFQRDFIELFNRGTTTVDFSITNYSVQYASAGSNFGGSKTDLTSGTIAPGHYFLIQEGGGTTSGAPLPTPDATGTIAMGNTSGKVALVAGTTFLPAEICPGDDGVTPFNPSNAAIADFVGYGSVVCYEGSGPALAPGNTTADLRKAGGCVDTNDNAADFLVASPNPRNSSSPFNDCSNIRPDITINDVSVTEGNTGTKTVDFTVTLSASSTQTVTVDYATADGTATAGSDYQSTSGTLTFAPGETTKPVTVTIIGDTMDEPSETFFVNLTNAANGVIVDGQGQGTITDNDAAPTVSINDVAVAEGNAGTTNATFNVTLSAASGFAVTVNYATTDGTATAPDDYQSTSGTLTFAPGETTKPVTVLVNGDTTFEQNETFSVDLSAPVNATFGDNQGIGTITNDDEAPPTPALTIDDQSVSEGDSGTKVVTFTISLSPTSAQTVTVDYATANGTATAGADYQSTSGMLTFNPGDTTKTVSVTVNGDTLVEPDETFFVNLSNVQNAIILDPQGAGTITNDDTADLVISQVYGGGGNSSVSGGTAPYTNDFIEIFNRGTTTVDFSVTNYSVQYASAGANFGSTSASNKTNLTTGTIAPGRYFLIQEASGGASGVALPTPDATGTIALGNTSGKVALVANTAPLPAEICPGDDGNTPFNPSNAAIADFVGYGSVVCYEGSGPALAPGNATADFRKAGGCTDTDDNLADFFTHTPIPRNSGSPLNDCSASVTPALSIDDVTVTEGNSGTSTATFTVSLSSPASGADVIFDIATQNNTALSGSDYVAKTATSQIIPAGSQSYTFSVTINGDTVVEPDETFFVNVTNVTGASVSKGQGVGTIQNDDLPTLSINDVTQAEGNSGPTTFTFTVQLSSPAPANVTFDIATADGTATTADNDYVARSLTSQTITAGQQVYSFDVTVNGDTVIEPSETFVVNVTNISGATGLDTQGVGTIQNDDSPALSINDVALNEGNTGATTFSFTVHLSVPAPAGGVTFDIATADGTAQDDNPATEDNDYVARSLTTQTIPEGSQDYTFNVTVNGDTVVEPNETFFVNLSNAVGATILDGTGQGTIQNDDAADLVISQLYGGGGNTGATYANDFVEIFNHGTTTVNFAVTPYSIQYAGAGSNFPTTPTSSALTIINSGTIAPGGYFLVQEASGGAIGAALPAPDATGSIDLAATAGKVALVAGTTGVSPTACPGDDLSTAPTNPSGNNIVDFVGYGTTASCYEGTGRAPAPSNTTADFRKAGGCTETNDNAADFLVATPHARNTSSPINNCVAGTTPDLTISDATVTEGNSGTTTATFTVSLSSPAPSTDVTFNIATQNNTAVSGSDYTSKSSTAQVIPAGSQTYTFTVNVTGDTAVENDETFFVNVTSVTGANAVDTQGVGTIQNDDFPSLSINDVSLNEGNAGGSTFAFTVQLSAAAPTGGVTFDIATADGTAQDGTPAGEDTDYAARTLTTQTIPAGSQTFTFNVTVNGDTVIEPDETFFVNVSNVTGATISDGQGQGTILNDDSPNLSITDVTLNEGNAGTTAFTFTVTLSAISAQTVTVNYATADGTATAPGDYTAVGSTQLAFAPGETIKQVTIQVNGDTLSEANETFFVNLSGATNATIADNQGVGTITNDDAAAIAIPTAGQVIINEALVASSTTSTTRPDFLELYNTTNQTLDISGLVVSFRPGGAGNTPSTVTLPGAVGSGTTTIAANSYFIIVNGASVLNGAGTAIAADYNPGSGNFDLNGTGGGIKIEVNGVKLDGLTYQGSATAINATFVAYGEGTIFTFTSATTNDLVRSSTSADTNNNASDFRHLSSTTTITPKAVNPP